MTRSLVLALLASTAFAASASAQTRPQNNDKPLSDTAARAALERNGYGGSQTLHRSGDASWVTTARDRNNAAVVVGVGPRGKVQELR